MYIDDLIDVIFLILKNSKTEGQIINIASGKIIKIKKIIKKILRHYKSGNPQFNKIKLRKEEQIKIYPSLYKIKKIIRWKAKVNFSEGLKRTIQYYNDN